MNVLLTFSQEKEDLILFHLLKGVGGSNVRWVDVGANDPLFMSVTKLFSSMGGKGVNIEPQTFYCDALAKDRPDDINIQVGISDENGELLLYGDGAGASFDADLDVQNKEKVTKVPVVTLKKIFDDNVGKDGTIHFLKIDVEGWEKKCLLGMDFRNYRPWIVCMESALPSTDIPSYDDWEYILTDNGYKLIGAETINRYYAAEEVMDQLNKYIAGDDIEKYYNVINYYDYMYKKGLFNSKVLKPFKTLWRGWHKVFG